MAGETTDPTAVSLASSTPAAESNMSGGETSECSNLVSSLLTMGLEKEQIEQTIGDLRGTGSEIDADSIIGKMTGEINHLGYSWDFIHSTVRDFEPRHELSRR